MGTINNRLFYAVSAVGFSKDGFNTYTAMHGVQAFSMNTRYNLDAIFELGQISLYDQPEDVPDVEVTLEKVLDGYPPLYSQATNGATSPTLAGRSALKFALAATFHTDTQNSASGTPITQVVASGLFPSQLGWTFPIQGNFSESMTAIGNNKVWLQSGFTFTPAFDNLDSPLAGTASGTVNKRQDLITYPGANGRYTRFPTDMPGISSSGTNNTDAGGNFTVHVQSIRVQTNLGREPMYELGRRGFYHRYVSFPVEVRTDYEFNSTSGDLLNASETATSNVNNQTMSILSREGTYIDLGSKNKCTSVSLGGGNASRQGGNVSHTFSYLNYNDLSFFHPADPSSLV